MRIIQNPELKGILTILLIALALGTVLAGVSGKLEQWGLPWFTGGRMLDKIIFVSDRSGTNEIYIMDMDGSHQRQLTSGAKALSAPAISSVGNKVAFVGMVGSVSQVMAVGAGGGKPYALTSSTGSKRQPGFSPDGKRLSYIESGRVWVAELSGSNPDPVLPTHEEIALGMQDSLERGQIPMYSLYAWGADSDSMAGVSSQSRLMDALTCLTELEGKPVYLIPHNTPVSITGLRCAADTPAFAVTFVNIGDDPIAGLATFEPDSEQLKALLVKQSAEFGTPGVSPDGDVIVAPFADKNGDGVQGLIRVDTTSDETGLLCNGVFENPVFSSDGQTIIATKIDPKSKKKSVVTVDVESGRVKTLAENGNCFDAVFSPTSKK